MINEEIWKTHCKALFEDFQRSYIEDAKDALKELLVEEAPGFEENVATLEGCIRDFETKDYKAFEDMIMDYAADFFEN